MAPAEAEPLLQAVAAVAIAQQKARGLDEYTGGETAADTSSFTLRTLRAGWTGWSRPTTPPPGMEEGPIVWWANFGRRLVSDWPTPSAANGLSILVCAK
jgi:hypothetical protein